MNRTVRTNYPVIVDARRHPNLKPDRLTWFWFWSPREMRG